MSAPRRWLAGWIALWDQREPATALALVRVGVSLVLLWDMVEVARLGLVEALWAPIEAGGIGPSSLVQPISVVYAWIGASAGTAWLLFAVVCTAAVALLIGAFTRSSALVLVLSYAQLAQLSPEADRGIDTLLRNVLLLLALSGAGATLSLDAWRARGSWLSDAEVPAWPRYLIVLQLVVLYFWAGLLKQAAPWTSLDGYSALYLILNQPHYATNALDPELVRLAYPLLRFGTFATVTFERTAPAVPLLMYLRATRARGGRLRALVNRARLLELWVATGVGFHIALAVTMQLGIFPWGCLALYPAIAQPDTLRAIVARLRSAAGTPATPAPG